MNLIVVIELTLVAQTLSYETISTISNRTKYKLVIRLKTLASHHRAIERQLLLT